MSAKRQATTNLNHENWDREEEPEERGTFRAAPEDELNKRVIKKARRQITGTAADDADGGGGGASKSVFSGFAGFGKTATSSGISQGAAAASPFSFLAKIPTAATSSTSSSAIATTTSKPTFSFGGAATTTTAVSADVNKLDTKIIPKSTETGDKSASYYAKLKGLNQAVSDWIKTHVDKNPLCILSPVFKDYENYLKEIETDEKKSAAATIDTSSTTSTAKSSATSTAATFGSFKFSASTTSATPTALTSTTAEAKSTSTGNIFGNIDKPASSETTKTNGFSFGLKTDDKSTASTSSSSTLAGFSFGKPPITSTAGSTDEKKPATGFSFTPGATPFSFGNIKPPAAMPTSTSNADEDDEEDQPPKVEFKQVVEDDAVFSKKCKVFVKKDGNFADRGVGTVYLKPVKDSEKTQLLVRADTNLGNILVNLILGEAIPAQRMGKNNVMLVCVPTPDVSKPTPILLRVKTAEEADELLKAIEKYKK